VAATQSAESRLGALLLAQAEAALPRDPTAAIGWLKSHARGRSPDPEAITRIAREATARGVAHHVLTGLSLPTVSPDGRLMAAISDQHLVLIELDSLVRRDLGPVDGALGLSFSGDGATLALSAAAGITLWPSAGGAPRPLPDTRGAWATTLDHKGRTVACYRNGRLVVLGLDDQRRIELDSQVMSILALSPDGRTLLGRSYQGDSWLWDLEARVSTTLPGTGLVAVLSPAGDRVAWASADGTLTLHEVATGKQRSLGHTSTKVNAVAFSPDGTTIASAGGDGMLTEWSLAGAIVSRRYATTDLGMLSYSPDGARLVALGGDRVVRVWQRGTSFVTSLPAAQARQHVPAWGAGGATLVMTGSDGEVRIFRMPTTLGLGTFALAPPLLQVGLIAGGDVAIAAGDGRVLLMDPSTGKTRVAGKPGQQEQRIAASPASSVVLSSGQDGIVTRYDLATRTDSTMVLDRGQVDSLWYAPDGRSFAVVLADHNIVVVAQGGEAHLLLNRTALASLRFSPDSKQLALSLMASSVRLYDTVKQSSWLLHTSDDEGEADSGALAFSPDGAILAGGGSDGVLRLWSTSQDSTRQLRELRGHKGHINDLAFSPDGASLVTASSDYSARIWDVAAGTARALRHPTVVQCLALSPDGKWLATGDTDGGLRLWQVSSGRLEAVWRQHEGSIERVLFTPDAGHLVSSGVDGNVRSVAVPPPPAPISAADLAELTTAELDRDGQPVSAP